MFSFLGFTIGLPAIILYAYVALAIVRGEYIAGANIVALVSKAALWPLTIWSTIQNLYDKDPLN